MTTSPSDLPGDVQASWARFLIVYEPLRSALYRYCRHLSQSPWDAEDLVQETMARAFVTLGLLGQSPPNPQAWLFRVASNLWIDQARRQRDAEYVAEATESPERRAPREAAGTLMVRLSPQERAAIVLKDVFDLTLEEVAETLSTTVGAIKAALSRGRGKLIDPRPPEERVLATGALDAFCDAFNARDVDRLTALLLDTAIVEIVGTHTDYGPEAARTNALYGMMYGSERLAQADTLGGIEPRYIQGALPTLPRCEVRTLRGEPLILSWYAHHDGEAVRAITRIEAVDGRIKRLQNYFFTPEFIAEVCAELGVPFRVNGYRSCLNT